MQFRKYSRRADEVIIEDMITEAARGTGMMKSKRSAITWFSRVHGRKEKFSKSNMKFLK